MMYTNSPNNDILLTTLNFIMMMTDLRIFEKDQIFVDAAFLDMVYKNTDRIFKKVFI